MLFFTEFRNFQRCPKSADVTGIMIFLVNALIITAITVAPLANAVLNRDPIYTYFCKIKGEEFILTHALPRFIIFTWMYLEGGRICCLVVTAAMMLFYMVCRILKHITSMNAMENGLKRYRELQVLIEIGREGSRQIFGVLLACGFFFTVTVNFLVVYGHKHLSLALHICFVLIDVATYVTIFRTIPMAVNCYNMSLKLIHRIWRHRLALFHEDSGMKMKIIKKILLAQKPITFYYGPAMLDQDTKSNFPWKILEFTITLLLI